MVKKKASKPLTEPVELKEEIKTPEIKKDIKKPESETQKINVSDLINKCKQKASNTNASLNKKGFPVGSRVFHSTFGIGFIKDSKEENGDIIYTVDFTKSGTKTLENKTSNLKAF